MRLLYLLLLMVVCTSCLQQLNDAEIEVGTITTTYPNQFDFETRKEINLQAMLYDNGNKPLTGVPLTYGFKSDGIFYELGASVSNKQGIVFIESIIPSFVDSVEIRTNYLGLPNETKVAVSAGSHRIQLGGYTKPQIVESTTAIPTNARTDASLTYLSTYDGQGVPHNLMPVNDYIPQDLLDLINSTLPEQAPVPTNNPQYLQNSLDTDIKLIEAADVWITFVHEGAGYRNSLGYYTYDLANPPTSAAQINNLKIIFPNVSFAGSGGNLSSGNKVFLGRFPAGTGIGWFLIPNGWNGSQVAMNSTVKYSNKAFNTITTEPYRQHTVLLQDPMREIVLLGMEDITRPGGDNDFNDAVFYVTANPFQAIDNSDLAATKPATGTDTDSDGVLDKNDKYPTDPQKAFDMFTPGNGVFGSLAFEDQWPAKGDYDMNDLVIDYNFKLVANTANEVVEIKADFLIRAVGAAYRNGFGFELPIDATKVQSVTGSILHSNLVTLQANGTEAGNTRAVIIVTDDSKAFFNTSGFVNTKPTESLQNPFPISLTIKFAQPIKMADLGYAPFNSFLMVNGDRGREVHLPDFQPTQKANVSLLGTSADTSRPNDGRYYKSGNNMPWAINLGLTFDYPVESRPVHEAHKMFSTWAQSSGITYRDWYKNLQGYRTPGFVFAR